jgi:hypothetical protein
MSEFSDKQERFTLLKAHFVIWCFENGYRLTDGDAYRDPRVHGEIGIKMSYSHKDSGHKNRLAQDWNLRIDNVYQTDSAAYDAMGEKWLSMSEEAAWGGDWGDGNHFSFEHNGIK